MSLRDDVRAALWPIASAEYHRLMGDKQASGTMKSKLQLAQQYAAEVRKRKGMNVTRVKT